MPPFLPQEKVLEMHLIMQYKKEWELWKLNATLIFFSFSLFCFLNFCAITDGCSGRTIAQIASGLYHYKNAEVGYWIQILSITGWEYSMAVPVSDNMSLTERLGSSKQSVRYTKIPR